jgi:hypothetical protein
VEVGQAVLALHLVDAELDLAESMFLVVLEIGQGDFENAALEVVVGVLQTGGAVDERLADTVGREKRGCQLSNGLCESLVDCSSLLSDLEGRRRLEGEREKD